jgi:hypothetical protein
MKRRYLIPMLLLFVALCNSLASAAPLPDVIPPAVSIISPTSPTYTTTQTESLSRRNDDKKVKRLSL